MNMQVNNNGITSNTNAGSKTKEPVISAKTPEDNPAPPPRDSVQLSREAQALKRLESQVIASPDVDMGRVASIRQAIADGNYQIDAETIALKMLESDSER